MNRKSSMPQKNVTDGNWAHDGTSVDSFFASIAMPRSLCDWAEATPERLRANVTLEAREEFRGVPWSSTSGLCLTDADKSQVG